MAKLTKPVLFTEHFKISPQKWRPLELFDPSLNVDTRLFIDPMLLEGSSNKFMKKDAQAAYVKHFVMVVKLLRRSKQKGDTAWKGAANLLQFPEVRGTCLGYGASTTAGSAFGRAKSGQLLTTAKDIVDLGVEDPELFAALSLLEKDIGPDLISDMTTNVIMPALIKLNEGVAKKLRLKTKVMKAGQHEGELVPNPFDPDAPVLLVPKDVLRHLPVAQDWDQVQAAISFNNALRKRVNDSVFAVWREAIREHDKQMLKEAVLTNTATAAAFLDGIKGLPKKSYDMKADPLGLIYWRTLFFQLAVTDPLKLEKPKLQDLKSLNDVVTKIVNQFSHLIENRDLWRDLWNRTKPRPEKSAQRMFFAVAASYCDSNDIDISPEADTGRGPVDFKFSKGSALRHLVEVKLSNNNKLVKGYTNQLELYKQGEKTFTATYLVIDIGKEGKKFEAINKARAAAIAAKKPASDIVYVDGAPKQSASKA